MTQLENTRTQEKKFSHLGSLNSTGSWKYIDQFISIRKLKKAHNSFGLLVYYCLKQHCQLFKQLIWPAPPQIINNFYKRALSIEPL